MHRKSQCNMKMVEAMLLKEFKHCLICTERDEKVRNRDLAFTGGKFVLSLWTTFDSSKSLLCVFIKQTELN